MRKLKIISLFLSLLLSVQMLPIQQIGNMLGQNQWNEELPHNADEPGKSEGVKNLSHPFIPPSEYANVGVANMLSSTVYIHHSEQIPSNHSTEIVAPPPDLA